MTKRVTAQEEEGNHDDSPAKLGIGKRMKETGVGISLRKLCQCRALGVRSLGDDWQLRRLWRLRC